MAKKINVEGHVARYEDTDLSDVYNLISGLTDLIERRKADTIADMEKKLAILKSGQIPVEEEVEKPTISKRKRNGKKTVETDSEA